MSELRIENLMKAFGNLVVTNNVSLTIPAGERRADGRDAQRRGGFAE